MFGMCNDLYSCIEKEQIVRLKKGNSYRHRSLLMNVKLIIVET